MATFSSTAPSSLSRHLPPHFQAGLRHQRLRMAAPLASKRYAGGSGRDFGGELVDEHMIELRKRMHDMEMAERGYEPPAGWTEWEKEYYSAGYVADVCTAVGLLQSLLMNTRPGVAVGVAALLALSVPTSAVVILFHLMQGLSSVALGLMHLK